MVYLAELRGEPPKLEDISVLQNPMKAALKAQKTFAAKAFTCQRSQPRHIIVAYLCILLCFCTVPGAFERLEVGWQLGALQEGFRGVFVILLIEASWSEYDRVK